MIDLSGVRAEAAGGFVAVPLASGDGHTWTLTTLLGWFLREAEARYGRRDLDWCPLGVEFSGDIPHVWYPGGCRNVAICLTASAANDLPQAVFQLAHETIHLLSPSGGENARVIEEGLATLFCDEMAARCGIPHRTRLSSYLSAASDTTALLTLDPDAIRHLREKRPRFGDFTPEFILETIAGAEPALARRLCEPFVRAQAYS